MVILAGATEGQVYDTLAEAVEKAAPESTIRFLEGAELTEWIGVNKELTFDLNGQKVTAAVPFAANQDALFAVNRGGKLTITDSATGGEIDSGAVMCAIKMTQTKAIDYVDPALYTDANKAILVVNGGTIKGFNYAIAGNGNPGRGNTEITINGGTLIASDEGVNLLDKCSCAIYNPSENSTLTITGGSITGYDSAVEIRAGSLTVTGGSLTAKNETYAVKGNGNGPTVTGAALAVSQHTTKKELGATVSEVTGATLTGAKAVAVVNPQLNTTDNVEVELGEATYNGALAYEADGNAVVTDNNSGLAAPAGYAWDNGVLKALVVQIVGGKQYTSLGAAIADLTGTGDETIELLKDYTAADAESLVFAKDATLDLGEFELTLPAALLSGKKFKVADGASVSFENGTITMGDSAYGLQVHGTATVSCTMTKLVNDKQGPIFDVYGVGYDSTDGGTVYVVAGANIDSARDVFRHKKGANELAAPASIYVSGGTLNSISSEGIFFGSTYAHADDVVQITGGTFNGNFGSDTLWGKNGSIKFGAEATNARFADKTTVTKYLADGFELVAAEEEGYWKIAKIPTYTVAAITVDNAAVEATNKTAKTVLALPATVLRDTEIAVTVTPAEHYEYKDAPAGWTKNADGSITTNATVTADLAITVEAPKLQQFTVSAISVENATAVATNTATKTGLDLPATVDYNTEIAVTVTPDTGYEYKTLPAGWTKNENGSITTNATVTADLAIKVEAPTAALQPVKPGEPITPAPGDDKAKINSDDNTKAKYLKAPDGYTADKAYRDLFDAVDGSAAGTIKFELNANGTNAVVEAEAAASANALETVLAATGDSTSMTVPTEQVLKGFFYSLKQGAALQSIGFKETSDANKLGGKDTISFTLAKPVVSGFYQMLVTPTAVPVGE